MKNIIFIIIIAFIAFTGQAQSIQLQECIAAAINNRATIQSAKTELMIANLQKSEALSRYIPQVSINYEYRYNPIIQSQVVPVGQFKPTPDNETRAIQFGTNWQQNIGLNVTQPILDFSIKSRVEESKINERLKNMDISIATDELKVEVLKSFANIYQLREAISNAGVDTLRTFASIVMISNKFSEGRVLKTDVNKSILNHNNALANFRLALSALVKEKIYLSFLTGLSLERLLNNDFDFQHLLNSSLLNNIDRISIDSIARIQQLNNKEALVREQIKSENRKYLPSINFQGYLGANQFSDKFNPFLSNSWFGSSYLGLSAKMPFLLGESKKNHIQQFELQSKIIGSNRIELEDQVNRDFLHLNHEIEEIKEQIAIIAQNVALMTENVQLFQDRFSAGQFNANELNLQEIDLQKEKNILLEKKAQLTKKEIDRIHVSGNLGAFLKALN
jgi:outer membrane protein